MPLGLDFIDEVVNVQWSGGAVFVASGYSEFVLCAEIKSQDDLNKEDLFTDLGPLDFTFQGPSGLFGEGCYIGAASYTKIGENKTPTFLLGGNDSVKASPTANFGTGSVIMISHNGKNWTKVFRKQWPGDEGNGSGVKGLAWDNGNFYGYVLSGEYYEEYGSTEVKTYEHSLTSSNGESWAETGSELRYDSKAVDGVNPPPNLSPPTLFMPHLKPDVKLPEGKFAYYEKRDNTDVIVESFLAKPTVVDPLWYLNDQPGESVGSTIDLTILRASGETIVATKTTPIKVMCVAYHRDTDILMVGGRTTDYKAIIASSIDEGDTWKTIWQTTDPSYQFVSTLTAGSVGKDNAT